MLVSDIMTRVKRAFGDEASVQVTDADVFRWINDGMRFMVKANEGLLEKSATSGVTANTQDYALPVDLLILRAIHFKYTGESSYTALKGMTFNQFEEYIDGWDGASDSTGRPEVYTIFAGQIKLFPIPDQTVATAFKIYYNRIPTDVGSSSETPEIPVLYHEALVSYCLKQAYEMDENYEFAGIKAGEVAEDLILLRDRDNGWKREDKYPTITVLWEDL